VYYEVRVPPNREVQYEYWGNGWGIYASGRLASISGIYSIWRADLHTLMNEGALWSEYYSEEQSAI
jgi:hypothetical protein